MYTPTFKPYNQDQAMLFPPSLEDFIPADHVVRVVNEVINKIDTNPLLDVYSLKGSSSYHPELLLKVLVYGYVNNIYSSRKLEEACKVNVHFMWLSAMNYPDHNTINRFRSVRLKEVLRNIFEEVVKLLAEAGVLSIDEVYTDGTKIEANANKYTFVWKKSIQTNKEKMGRQLNEIWEYAQNVAHEEDNLPEPPDFTTVDKDKVNATIAKLNAVLKEKPEVDKKVKAKLRYVTKNFPETLDKYEQQEQILGERNSYSKTDNDATFMRMKEDHMENGQLKPGYNVQISSSNQYIVNYSIHSNPTDTTTLPSHINQHKDSYGEAPKVLTADAGYGSEENYEALADNNIEGYVKYNMFDKEQSENSNSKHPFAVNKLHYNAKEDYYICPMGQQMNFIGSDTRLTSTGFKQNIKRYRAQDCSRCPLNGVCHKSKHNRTIEINESLNAYKQQAKELLNSEEGVRRRKKRCCDVEPVFGNIKQNHGFRRFMLRGKQKVEIEFGLLAIAQNLRKKAA